MDAGADVAEGKKLLPEVQETRVAPARTSHLLPVSGITGFC